MTTIAQFNIYGQPLMLTGGGPNNSTRVLMMYIQENAFGSSTSVAGISSAMAILLGFVIMAVSIVQFMVIKNGKIGGMKMRENKLGKRIAFILLATVCVIWIFPLIWAILPRLNRRQRFKRLGSV